MSKLSENKEKQGFQKKCPCCGNCKNFSSKITEMVSKYDPHYTYKKEENMNAKMKTKGLLTDLERQSRKGVKKFKSLTKTGLEYGENHANPNNPKETQPLWHDGTFDELLALLGFKISA